MSRGLLFLFIWYVGRFSDVDCNGTAMKNQNKSHDKESKQKNIWLLSPLLTVAHYGSFSVKGEKVKMSEKLPNNVP